MTTWFGANCYGGPPGGATKNEGVRCTLSFTQRFSGSFWISEYSSGGLWGQVGITGEGRLFFQVFRNGQLIKTSKVTGKPPAFPAPGDYVLEMSRTSGSKWHFMVNGRSQGTYDMGSPDAPNNNIVGCCEGGTGLVPVILKDFQLKLVGGSWVTPVFGTAEAIVANYGNPIGVYGNVQDPTIPVGAVRIGGAANLNNGDRLWG